MKNKHFILLIILIIIFIFNISTFKRINTHNTEINVISYTSVTTIEEVSVEDKETVKTSVNTEENNTADKATEENNVSTSIKSETTPKKNNTSSKPKTSTTNTQNSTKSSTEKFGTNGRLYLPSLNHSVALYNANITDNDEYNAQAIVDRKDSAAYFQFFDHYVVADHNYQGFKKLNNLKIGAKAYIKQKDGSIENYILTQKFIGKNIGIDIVDSNGNSIADMSGDLVMYTCYDSNNKVIVTIWNLEK